MFSMLIRTANRRDGNSSRHSQVLAQYEDGAECYDNLRQTVYSDTYPVRSFVQLLLDNQLVALAFKVKNGQSTIDCIAPRWSKSQTLERRRALFRTMSSLNYYLKTTPPNTSYQRLIVDNSANSLRFRLTLVTGIYICFFVWWKHLRQSFPIVALTVILKTALDTSLVILSSTRQRLSRVFAGHGTESFEYH